MQTTARPPCGGGNIITIKKRLIFADNNKTARVQRSSGPLTVLKMQRGHKNSGVDSWNRCVFIFHILYLKKDRGTEGFLGASC